MKNGTLQINPNGNKYWRLNGKYHRLDGPAFIGIYGYKAWWINGKRHRLDGPAYIGNNGHNGYKAWWINGVEYTEEEFNERRFVLAWKNIFRKERYE